MNSSLTSHSYCLLWWEVYGIDRSLTKYGILQSENSSSNGEKITTFYDPGEFPKIDRITGKYLQRFQVGYQQWKVEVQSTMTTTWPLTYNYILTKTFAMWKVARIGGDTKKRGNKKSGERITRSNLTTWWNMYSYSVTLQLPRACEEGVEWLVCVTVCVCVHVCGVCVCVCLCVCVFENCIYKKYRGWDQAVRQ